MCRLGVVSFLVVCYCNHAVVCADLVFSFILVCYCNLTMVCADLVWSDPEDVDTWAMSPRGAGWLFGAKVTAEVRSLRGVSSLSVA